MYNVICYAYKHCKRVPTACLKARGQTKEDVYPLDKLIIFRDPIK